MDASRLQRFLQLSGGGLNAPPQDGPQVDTAEQVYISSLALLKMLKHGSFFPILSMHKIDFVIFFFFFFLIFDFYLARKI